MSSSKHRLNLKLTKNSNLAARRLRLRVFTLFIIYGFVLVKFKGQKRVSKY